MSEELTYERKEALEAASYWATTVGAFLQKLAPNVICVWEFYKAPPALRELSQHGGDEDWLAWVPNGNDDMQPMWTEANAFGCAGVDDATLGDGSRVYIGAHA